MFHHSSCSSIPIYFTCVQYTVCIHTQSDIWTPETEISGHYVSVLPLCTAGVALWRCFMHSPHIHRSCLALFDVTSMTWRQVGATGEFGSLFGRLNRGRPRWNRKVKPLRLRQSAKTNKSTRQSIFNFQEILNEGKWIPSKSWCRSPGLIRCIGTFLSALTNGPARREKNTFDMADVRRWRHRVTSLQVLYTIRVVMPYRHTFGYVEQKLLGLSPKVLFFFNLIFSPEWEISSFGICFAEKSRFPVNLPLP
jgi:hypothetical protein